MTKIICIEGLDGSGKTTLIDRVKKKLEADGQKVLLTSPFLTTDYDVQFKSDILNSKDVFLETTGMANILYRFQNHLRKLIDSNDYDVILIDRYLPSFYVYQMYAQDHQSMLSSMLLYRLIVRDTFNIEYFFLVASEDITKMRLVSEIVDDADLRSMSQYKCHLDGYRSYFGKDDIQFRELCNDTLHDLENNVTLITGIGG